VLVSLARSWPSMCSVRSGSDRWSCRCTRISSMKRPRSAACRFHLRGCCESAGRVTVCAIPPGSNADGPPAIESDFADIWTEVIPFIAAAVSGKDDSERWSA